MLDRIIPLWHARTMAFWVYLLRCGDGSFYAGHTDALDARIAAPLNGKGSDYTARRQPVTFAWAQGFPSRIEALESERRIKGWSRAKKEAMIVGDWERVSRLACSNGARPSTSSGRTVDPGAVRAEPVEARALGAASR